MGKKLKLFMGVAASLFFASASLNADGTEYQNLGYNAQVLNESALPVAKEVVIDTNKLGINRISAQITASTANVSSVTFYDGKQSTMQVTISSNVALSSAVAVGGFTIKTNTALSPARAVNYLYITSNSALSGTQSFNSITITSMSALSGSTITFSYLAGTTTVPTYITYIEGIDWNLQSSSMASTICLSTTLADNPLISITSAGVGGLDVISMQSTNIGARTNYGLWSSTPAALVVSYSSFTNGFDNGIFSISGSSYVQGVDWYKLNTATATAINISTSINNSNFSITANVGGFSAISTVTITVITPGTAGNDYTLTTSTTAINRYSATFSGGTDQTRAHFAINGSSFTEGTHWGAKTLSSETATSIAYAINRTSITLGVKASAVGVVVYTTPIAVVRSSHGVITGTPDLWGTLPNSWTLTVSTGALLSSGTFSGGRDRAVLTINGSRFRNGFEWYSDSRDADLNFSSDTAKSLRDAINLRSTNTLVVASYSTGTYASNTITITSMSALSGSTLTVNDVNLREGIEWKVLSSSMLTTICLSTAIATVPNVVITSAGVGGLDIITCYVNLLSEVGNLYDMTSSTPAAMTVSNSSFTGGLYSTVWTTSVLVNQSYEFFTTTQGALAISSYTILNSTSGAAIGYMQGGFDSDISTITNLISKSNSFNSGLPVLYTTSTATGLSGLQDKTTYYVKSPTKISFYLSRTSTGAVATTTTTRVSFGSYTTLISTGKGTYNLAPWLFAGISSMTFQVSNDGINYNMTPYSVAITSATSADSTYFWDMGDVNYRWLKLNIATPTVTGGGVDVKAWINGKN